MNFPNVRKMHPRPDPVALEDEVRDLVKQQADNRPSLPLPDYVRHVEGVSDVGRLAAQAIATDYEASAASIEQMGTELVAMIKRSEEDTLRIVRRTEDFRARAEEALEVLKSTAQLYRDEAAAIFSKIENSALLTEEVRRHCQVMSRRIHSNEPVKTKTTEEGEQRD